MGRVVAEGHRALVRRAGHHVEVVHRVAGRSRARTVVAVRHQDHVVVAHLEGLVDRRQPGLVVLRAGVGAVEAAADTGRSDLVGSGDPVVVDLLVDHLARRGRVVLVGRVARPVAGRGDQLAADELLRVLPDTGHPEVVDLSARVARAARLDRYVGRGAVAGLEPGAASRGRDGHLRDLVAEQHDDAVAAHVDEVGDGAEHARPAVEVELRLGRAGPVGAGTPRRRATRAAAARTPRSVRSPAAPEVPGESRTTRRPVQSQPASSGVSDTSSPVVWCDPAKGR